LAAGLKRRLRRRYGIVNVTASTTLINFPSLVEEETRAIEMA
jgi:hypothetical protein